MSAVPGFRLGVPAVTTIDVLLNAYAPPVPSNPGPTYATPVFVPLLPNPEASTADEPEVSSMCHSATTVGAARAGAAVMVGAAKARKSDIATNGERARHRQMLFNPGPPILVRLDATPDGEPRGSALRRHPSRTFASQQVPVALSAISPPGRMNRSAQPWPNRRRRTTPRPFSRTAEFAIGTPNG